MKYLFSFFIALSLFSCSHSTETTSTNPSQVVEADTFAVDSIPPAKIELFNQVIPLLSILSVIGIGRMRDWRDDELGGFISSTPYFEFGTESDRLLKSNLAFYAESPVDSQIQTVKLMLNVNNAVETKTALQRYADVASLTLKRLGLPALGNFKKALQQGEALAFDSDSLQIKNEVHHDRIDWYKLTITAK